MDGEMMDKKTLKALKGSIQKWEKIVKGKGVDKGSYNCPLCKLFVKYRCVGCPVSLKTKDGSCTGTPYDEWEDHFFSEHEDYWNDQTDKELGLKCQCDTCREIAQKEVDFLKSLLPGKEK